MNGELPAEVWAERDVAATLSDFDLGPESRAVELVCVTGQITHTLTADGSDGSEDGTGRGTPIIAATLTGGCAPNGNAPGRRNEDDVNLVPTAFHQTQDPITEADMSPALGATSMGMGMGMGTTVRRLTPTECERLQGFPDGHTATSNGKPQADGPRYRQMGNAVAVPVFEWVIGGIVASEARP